MTAPTITAEQLKLDFAEARKRIADLQQSVAELALTGETSRERDENVLLNNCILVASNKIFQEALHLDTEEEFVKICLKEVIGITGSTFGFVGERGTDGCLHGFAVSDMGWQLCSICGKTGHSKPPGSSRIRGLYGHVLSCGKSLLTNDPSSHPDSTGIPEAHPPLENFLGVPMHYFGKVIGVLAVANRNGGFTSEQQDFLEVMAPAIAQALKKIRVEKALKESEERFRRIAENMSDAISETDAHGAYVYTSPSHYKVLGYHQEDVIGKSIFDRVHPEDRDQVLYAYREAVQSKAYREMEFRYLHGNGDYIWVRSSGHPLFSDSGEFTGAVINTIDITKRKEAEEAQQRLLSELEFTYGSAPVGLALLDMDLRYVRVNERLAEINGLSPEDHIGRTIQEVTPNLSEQSLEALSRVIENGEPLTHVEFKGETAAMPGIERIWEENWLPVRDKDGAIIGISVVADEITERKRIEEEVRRLLATVQEERDRLSALVNSMTDEVWFADTHKRFILVNPSALQEFNLVSRGDMYVEKLTAGLEVLRPDGSPRPIDEAPPLRALQGEVIRNRDEIVRTPSSGEFRHRQVSAAPVMDKEGVIMGSVSVVRDITGYKRAEEELQKYREGLEELVHDRTLELEEKNRRLKAEIAERKKIAEEKRKVEAQLLQAQKLEAIGSFAGGIAHDLNNILYPIIINTEALLDEADPGTETHEILKQILEATHKQSALVKQILSFSRDGKERLTPVRITPLVESTLNFIRSTLPSSIEISTAVHAQSDTIMCDPMQIQQIIMNLCKNAADAMESQKGTIEVGLTNVRLDGDLSPMDMNPGEYLELTVRDTGHGIPRMNINRIFDPFFTTKPVGKGSGLGLSIVHGIVKRHGGAITVKSRKGKGSRFTVRIPLCGNGSRASSHGSDTRVAGGRDRDAARKTIFLVDDEDKIVTSLGRALEKIGHRVVSSTDSHQALELFSKNPEAFDLVITDMTMPRMTGRELGKKILEVRPDIPVILCTGFGDIIDTQGVKDMGFTGLLVKPAGIRELKDAISSALEGTMT